MLTSFVLGKVVLFARGKDQNHKSEHAELNGVMGS